MEQLKYSVSIKRGYKIFFTICSIVFLTAAISLCIWGIPNCKTMGNYVALLGVICFLLGVVILGLYKITKCVLVYKGKIIYRTIFTKKEYKPSAVFSSNTLVEEYEYHDLDTCSRPSTYDKITTFYNNEGKKLFAFGLAYENVEKLKKNVENNRKSVEGGR